MTFSFRKAQLWLAISLILGGPAFADTAAVKLAALEPKTDPRVLPANSQILSPGAKEIAELLGVTPSVDELIALHQKKGEDLNAQFAELKLHVRLTDSVLMASLQVRDVAARIEREIMALERYRGFLGDKRDRAIKYNSMANVFGMGVINEVGQAGEMKVNEIPGETTELVGGGIAMMLSAIALHLQSGQKQRSSLPPNMLSAVFDRPTNKDTQLPPLVWNYLNHVPPTSTGGQTRLNNLLQSWRRYRFIGNTKTPDGAKRAATLSNTLPRTMLNIDLCEDEIALLSDLRAEIYQIDRDLLQLLLNLQNI